MMERTLIKNIISLGLGWYSSSQVLYLIFHKNCRLVASNTWTCQLFERELALLVALQGESIWKETVRGYAEKRIGKKIQIFCLGQIK